VNFFAFDVLKGEVGGNSGRLFSFDRRHTNAWLWGSTTPQEAVKDNDSGENDI